MQNSLPRNFFLHPVQHIQAQDQMGKTSVHSLQSIEEQLPRMAEPVPFVCRSTGPFQKACCDPENNQRGLCTNRDMGDMEGSGGTETKISGLPNQTIKAERKVELSLSQTDVAANSEHLSQNEPKFIFNHLMGEASYRSCPNNPQSCGRIVRVKCNSVDCQMPNLEANVPAVLTHSDLSGESLLIKTL
jgi:hypothetical protein